MRVETSIQGQPLPVIASEAKQSILPFEERVDCFVASLLAMTNPNNDVWAAERLP